MSVVRPMRGRGQASTTLSYHDPAGKPLHVGPEAATAVSFEDCLPIRTFSYIRTQHNTPGLFWFSTTDRLIPYESHLESLWMLEADHDADVLGLSSQPFRIEHIEAGGSWEHTPDQFWRLQDGTARVVDVKDPRKLNDDDVVRQAERTRKLCAGIGWDYELVAQPDPQRTANLEWLAAYRRHVPRDSDIVERVLFLGRNPVTVGELADAIHPPAHTLPVLFHLIWNNRLWIDLNRPLTRGSYVMTKEPSA